MALANFIEEREKKSVEQHLCNSADLTAGLRVNLTLLSGVNSFLSVTAFLGNVLILIALHKESSLHPPSKLLLRCLATADLCVGLISEPLTIIYWMSVANEYRNIWPLAFVTHFITSYTLCGVSVGTVTAISVDRLLALLLGLRYRQVVTSEANLRDGYYLMGFECSPFNNVVLESLNNLMVWHHRHTTVSYNLDLLLHKDFPYPPSP